MNRATLLRSLILSAGLLTAHAVSALDPVEYSTEISNFASGFFIPVDTLDRYPQDPRDIHPENETFANSQFVRENRIDWKQATIANDAEFYYVSYTTHGVGSVALTWGQSIYLDTDQDAATGWQQVGPSIGADFVIQGSSVYAYEGDDAGTQWQWSAPITINASSFGDLYDDARVLQIPRAAIGSPDSFNLLFVGSNEPYGGDTTDTYPDGAFSDKHADRYFTYNTSFEGNTVPVVARQQVTTLENQSLEITLEARDADGDPLTYTIYQERTRGTVSGAGPVVTYTPLFGWTGIESFFYTASDGAAESRDGFVFVTVQPDGSPEVSNYTTGLTVDGNLDDWQGAERFADDPADNESWSSNQIDLIQSAMAHSDTTLYLNYVNSGFPIENVEGWGFNTFLDTDSEVTTGYSGGTKIGSEFLLQGGSLFRYAGDGTSWAWTYLGDVQRSVSGANAEVGIDRAALGNPAAIRLVFYGDNLSIGGSYNDFYPSGIYRENNVERKYLSYTLDQSTFVGQDTMTFDAAKDGQPVSGLLNIAAPTQPEYSDTQYSGSGGKTGGGSIGLLGLIVCFSLVRIRSR